MGVLGCRHLTPPTKADSALICSTPLSSLIYGPGTICSTFSVPQEASLVSSDGFLSHLDVSLRPLLIGCCARALPFLSSVVHLWPGPPRREGHVTPDPAGVYIAMEMG